MTDTKVQAPVVSRAASERSAATDAPALHSALSQRKLDKRKNGLRMGTLFFVKAL